MNYEGGLADSFKTFQSTLSIKISEKYTGKSLLDKLKIDEWCYDDKVTVTDSFECDLDGDSEPDENQCTNEYYAAYVRKNPSLKCSGTILTKFKDNTDMYVGTLTEDEISFAGANSSTNSNYYLISDYTKDNYLDWWSLSPAGYFAVDFADFVFTLRNNGRIEDVDVDDGSVSSRPAITLKSGSVITEGDGTQSNPYVIE